MTRMTLEEASEFVTDGTHGSPKRTEDPRGIPLLSAKNVFDGEVRWDDFDRVPESELGDFQKRVTLRKGDVLMTCVGTIGRAAVWLNERPVVFFRSVAIIRPKQFLLPEYLEYVIRSADFQLELRRRTKQSSQGGVYLKDLKAVPISVPPLAEQEQIVKLLNEADELRKLRDQADHRTANLVPALFHEMFGDPFKKTTSWPSLRLGEIVNLGSGATPSKKNPDFWNGRTPWVSPKDMKAQEIIDAEDHVSESAFEKTNLELIPEDTVLIVVRGMILAHTVPIRLCRVPVAINQDMKALLPKQLIKAEFLRWSLQAQHAHLLNQVSTASHGTKKLDSENLRAVTIPVPPLPLQKEFAQRVAEIHGLEADQVASRGRLEDLFQSLLHRAFEGEL